MMLCIFLCKGVSGKEVKNMQAIVRYPGEEKVVPCPCGESHRFFTAENGAALGLHVTSISGAEPHYHKVMTESYFVLEGSGQIELDGEIHDVRPGTAILIPPGVVHRGIGDFRVIVSYDHPEAHKTDTYHPSQG